MAGMLELSDGGFLKTMINMLRAENMQEQMDNVSREMEILRKSQKEMVAIKKHCNKDHF